MAGYEQESDLQSAPVESPSRRGGGCVIALASVVIGVLLAFVQIRVLVGTWAYCGDVPYVIAVDNYPDGGSYISLFVLPLRLATYAGLFTLGSLVGMRWFGTRRVVVRVLLGCITGLVIAMLGFAIDFSLFNGMSGDASAYVPGKCPGGYLPWWPL